jgi:hypothetical protein
MIAQLYELSTSGEDETILDCDQHIGFDKEGEYPLIHFVSPLRRYPGLRRPGRIEFKPQQRYWLAQRSSTATAVSVGPPSNLLESLKSLATPHPK